MSFSEKASITKQWIAKYHPTHTIIPMIQKGIKSACQAADADQIRIRNFRGMSEKKNLNNHDTQIKQPGKNATIIQSLGSFTSP